MASPTVAWLDIRTRVGWCPIHVTGVESKIPERMGLVPVGVEGAAGKACDVCRQPLAAVRGSDAWDALYVEERL